MVTCPWCGQKFERDNPEYRPIKSGTRWYHGDCYDAIQELNKKQIAESKERNTQQEIEKARTARVKDLAYQWLGDSANFSRISLTIKSLIKEGWTADDIYNTLYYWVVVRQESAEKANGNIGILPYIKDDADKYYKQQQEAEERAANITEDDIGKYLSFTQIEREVPSKRYKIQKPKRSNFFKLE
jgi:hypothetical protein